MKEAFFTALINTTVDGVKNLFRKIFKKKSLSLEEIKKRTQILFIDDEPFDYVINGIRQANWNVKQIMEVYNPDSEDLKNADIIFVDFKGVGKELTPTDEGIGLLKLLKNKYPKKYFIFISGYAGLIPGEKFFDIADGWISKNSDPYVYIERIESAAKTIYEGK
jgi:hypothetical protein